MSTELNPSKGKYPLIGNSKLQKYKITSQLHRKWKQYTENQTIHRKLAILHSPQKISKTQKISDRHQKFNKIL